MSTVSGERVEVASPTDTGDRGVLVLLAALFFVSGACGLVYQQLWLRETDVGLRRDGARRVHGARGVLRGLAVGSVVAGRVVHRTARPLHWYGVAEIAIGVLAVLSPLLFEWSSASTLRSPMSAPDSRVLLTGVRFVLAIAA